VPLRTRCLRCGTLTTGSYCAGCKPRPARPPNVSGWTLSAARRQALAERGAVCQLCGATDRPVELHHINHDASDNRRENWLVVCRSCHGRLGRRRH
jgi:HNH endonuclease